MKKGVLYRIAVSTIAAALLTPYALSALEIRAAEQSGTQTGEKIENDLYLVGWNVTNAGRVTGDLVAAGGNLLITGPVQLDLTVVGGNVTITAAIGDDLRAGGGTVIVQGEVQGDVVIGGGQVTIGGAGVGGDVLIGGGAITIEAPIGGNVRIGGGEVTINGTVDGDVEVRAEKVTLGPKAVLSGDFNYSAVSEATISEGAIVRGETNYTERKGSKGVTAAGLAALFTIWTLARLLMMIVGAFALYFLFPRYTKEFAMQSGTQALPSLGIGLLFLIVVPVLSLLLLITVIGMPLGGLLLFGYIASLLFASITAPIVVGAFLAQWIWKRGYLVAWQTILLGVLVYFILGLIPVLGWIVKLAAFLIALGAALSIKWSIAKAWR